MARPRKDGMSFLCLDTDFFSDRKTKRLLKTFGGKGPTVYLYLLCEIYRENGYFIKWDEDYPEDIADALGSGFSSNLVSDVCRFCFVSELFDKNLFSKFGILTSRGIQKRFLSAKESINKRTYKPEDLISPDLNLLTEFNGIKRSLTELNEVEQDKTELIGTNRSKPPELEELEELEEEEKKDKAAKPKKAPTTSKKHKDIFDASDFIPQTSQIEDQSATLRTGEITAEPGQINDFLKVIGAFQASEIEKMNLSKAIEVGCTPEHLKILLQEKPKITSFRFDWVIRELIAIKRRIDTTGGNSEAAVKAELEKTYGSM